MRTLSLVVACCLSVLSVAVARAAETSSETKPAEKPMPVEMMPAAILPGHSTHGEAFDEGPRQAAYLMSGTGNVHFPITAKNPDAQAFFNQGVGQLHGFWYFEAERSFRQVVKLDPECAMGYWGLAQANANNDKRAKEFIAKAVKLKDKASERERRLIEAYNAYRVGDDAKKKERAEAYVQALEKLAVDFPDDLEIAALLVLQIYNNKSQSIPIQSMTAVDALLDKILAKEPLHPVHHYRIHLWDHTKATRALGSAALCGKSAPTIAHMWHMSGHTYFDLKRYGEAAWHQEAAARTDHARMMRDRILPDQIHNYSHNNEWLIRDMIHVGRMNDALALSRNMIELPQHPKYNAAGKNGSYYFGRMRIWEVLEKFERWDEIVRLADSPYLAPGDDEPTQIQHLRHVGAAYFHLGDAAEGEKRLQEVETRLAKLREEAGKAENEAEQKVRDKHAKPAEKKPEEPKPAEPAKPEEKKPEEKKPEEPKPADQPAAEKKPEEPKPAKPAEQPAPEAKPEDKKPEEKKAEEKKPEESKPADPPAEKKPEEPKPAEAKPAAAEDPKIKAEVQKARQDARKPFDERIKSLEKALDELRGQALVLQGDHAKALPLLKQAGTVDKGYLLWIQFHTGEKDKALKDAEQEADKNGTQVLPLARWAQLAWLADKKEDAQKAMEKLRPIACRADLSAPLLARLAPIAQHLGWPEDWRGPAPKIGEAEQLPTLDSLGPLTWSPVDAPSWTAGDAEGKTHSSSDFRGKPLVLILFLGSGCLHCTEQLQAFAPKAAEFEAAGFQVVAISSDDREGLQISLKNYKDGKFPFLLLSDAEKSVFRALRAYDDFEDQPLHATFILDPKGRIRWQDIGPEPFMDPKFVLTEGQRLMKIDP